MCSEPEFKEDVEGWIPGKVRYYYDCTRKLKFKRKSEEGTRNNKDKSSKAELEASKRWEFSDLKRFMRANLCMFSPSAIFNFGAKPEVISVPRPLALGFGWFKPGMDQPSPQSRSQVCLDRTSVYTPKCNGSRFIIMFWGLLF